MAINIIFIERYFVQKYFNCKCRCFCYEKKSEI